MPRARRRARAAASTLLRMLENSWRSRRSARKRRRRYGLMQWRRLSARGGGGGGALVRKLRSPDANLARPRRSGERRGEALYLGQADRAHVMACAQRLVPVDQRRQALLQGPGGAPVELALRCAGIDRQMGGLGGVRVSVDLPAKGSAPEL